MKWTEVIKINIGEDRRSDLDHQLQSLLSSMNGAVNPPIIRLYDDVQNLNLSILLNWEQGKPKSWGSETGFSLVEALKVFGLVSHTVWVERKQ